MFPRAAIAEIVADILQSGRLTPDHLALAAHLSAGGAIPDLLGYILAAGRRKRINLEAIDAAVALLHSALDDLRIANNGGNPSAPGHLVAVHQLLARQLARGGVSEEALVRIAHAFTRAQLDPGEALREALTAGAAEFESQSASASRHDLEEHLIGLAEMMDNDPFDIFTELNAMGSIMGQDDQGAIAAMLSDAPVAALRVASLGFVLSKNAAAAGEALGGMVSNGAYESGDRVSSRLRIMRPWLAPHRLPAMDEAIAAFAGLEKEAAAPEPASLVNLFCTCTDGAGGSSIFAVVKIARKHMLLGVLIKRASGVNDAWAHSGLSKAEMEQTVRKIVRDVGAYKVSLTLARRVLADALAINKDGDAPPPFGLLQVCDVLGLGEVVPERIETDALIAESLADLPADRISAEAVQFAHRLSADWGNRLPMLESWFEAGADLHAALRKLRTPARKLEVVMEQFLPARRAFWARNCAWAAAILRDAATDRDETWIDMALIARELAGTTPLAEIPLALSIAAQTVQAHAAN